MEPELEILGLYPVKCDAAVRDQALREKCPHCTSPADKAAALQQIERELGSLVLVEIAIRNRNDAFDAGDFGQPGSDQCAYMEHYLNLKGTTVVGKYFDVPPTSSLRMTFFLHFFDPTLPLTTSYGEFALPEATEMPARLKEIIHYAPVD